MQSFAVATLAVLLGVATAIDVPLKPTVGRNCNEHLQQVSNSGLIGAFRPKCDADGTYAALQTHGSIGMSFCVNKLGETITPPARGIRACECPRELAQVLHQGVMPGTKVPTCDTDGTYAPRQTHGSTGMSRCVKINGTEIAGYGPSRQIRACKCPRQRDTALTSGLMGAWAPACDAVSGHFSPRQTHEAYTFCVDHEGQQMGEAVHISSAANLAC